MHYDLSVKKKGLIIFVTTVTNLVLGFSTVNYKKGKYIRPQIEVFTYNFPFTDYNTPCLLEKNCTCSFLSHSINLKKFLLLRIFVYVLFWRNWVLDQWKDYLRLGWGLEVHDLGNPCRFTLKCYWEESVRNVTLVQCIYILALVDLSWKDGIVFTGSYNAGIFASLGKEYRKLRRLR